jgi:hypothetical protein
MNKIKTLLIFDDNKTKMDAFDIFINVFHENDNALINDRILNAILSTIYYYKSTISFNQHAHFSCCQSIEMQIQNYNGPVWFQNAFYAFKNV